MKGSMRTRLRGKLRQGKGKAQQVAGQIEDEAGKLQQRRERNRREKRK
jgi:uncharacterized protein YjbJ (UPF0337 family)